RHPSRIPDLCGGGFQIRVRRHCPVPGSAGQSGSDRCLRRAQGELVFGNRERLGQCMKAKLSPDLEYRIQAVESIQREKSGKMRVVKSCVKPSDITINPAEPAIQA